MPDRLKRAGHAVDAMRPERREDVAEPFRLKDGSVEGWLQRDYTWEQIMAMCYDGRGGF
ncbi:MAG TPA: hypothetical protein VKX45_23495 [Bryobacteraceae bacterium]|jgi:hypothetical protein|nr:hypothetical protein [Bryobacteraceae bacterium]